MASSVRAARLLDAALKESSPKWCSLYAVLHAPFLGCLCYVLAFRLELPYWLHSIVEAILVQFAMLLFQFSSAGVVLCVLMSLSLICRGGICLVTALRECVIARWRRMPWGDFRDDFCSAFGFICIGILTNLGSVLLLWPAFGAFTYISKVYFRWDPDVFEPYTPIFGNSTMTTIVDSGFRNSMTGIWMGILYLVFMTLFCFAHLPDGAQARNRVSWGNFLVTVTVFIYYLLT
jgi:hypothetical protein